MIKIKSLSKHFKKIKIIKEFYIGTTKYRISDNYNQWIPIKKERILGFKPKGCNWYYLHSSIYLNSFFKKQPIYITPQKIIKAWKKSFRIDTSLILGCAGCTLPRFLILMYRNCVVYGVEYSQLMIDLAKIFFTYLNLIIVFL